MAKKNIQKKSDEWGQGWDYLFKDIWPEMDKIRRDNLENQHDKENIDYCFKYLYSVLIKEVLFRIKNMDWDERNQVEVTSKTHKLIKLFKESNNYNDKVIAINMTEQFLRSIY